MDNDNYTLLYHGITMFRERTLIFIIEQLQQVYDQRWMEEGIRDALGKQWFADFEEQFERNVQKKTMLQYKYSENDLHEALDIVHFKPIIVHHWISCFREILREKKRAIESLEKAKDIRNTVAHPTNNSLPDDETRHSLDIMYQFMGMIDEQVAQKILTLRNNVGQQLIKATVPHDFTPQEENISEAIVEKVTSPIAENASEKRDIEHHSTILVLTKPADSSVIESAKSERENTRFIRTSNPSYILDNSRAPLLRLSENENKYISLLPVTKYQFERYIYEAAPSWCRYDAIVEQKNRIPLSALNHKNFFNLFLTNITFEEAQQFCLWVHGRLPSARDYEDAYHKLFREPSLLEDVLQTLLEHESNTYDQRLLMLLNVFKNAQIKRYNIDEAIRGFLCEFPRPPYGDIYLWHEGKKIPLAAPNPLSTRKHGWGFSYIVNIE